MSEIESPCIGVCSLNPETGQCHGCCRTPEEIEKWCTKDDLDDVKRSVFLLKKGYEIQKISVGLICFDLTLFIGYLIS